ncbi:MAG: PASTA domain-containing protein [Bacteroidaceae bacterium]|nr:PASTA domain-containing protein [Bacteroidaceae bacterium]
MSADKDKEFPGTESAPVSGKETKDKKAAKANKKEKKFPLWKNVLAMIVLVALFITGAYWASILYTRHGKEVAVPDLKGLTVRQAYERLDALELLGEVRDSIYNRNIAPGVICDQSVHTGNYVKVGRTIGLTVNSDHAPTLVLPDVADNMSYREAMAKLRSMGFTLGQPEYINGERDWVYSVKYKGYNVSVGTRIDINEPITLVVGDGHYMMDELEFDEAYGDTIGAVYGDILEIF